MSKRGMWLRIIGAAGVATLTVGAAQAGGFAIREQSAYGLGSAFAEAGGGAAATSLVVALSGLAAGFAADAGVGFAPLTASFDLGAAFGLDAVALPLPLLAVEVLALDGLAAGRFACDRLLAAVAGFLPPAALFAAGLRAVDLPFVAERDLRAGFTCFFAMVILVR